MLKIRSPLRCYKDDDFNSLDYAEQVMSVRQAAWICGNTWRENHAEKFAGVKIRIWSWLTRNENYPLAIAEFRNYLTDGMTGPGFARPAEDSESREMGAPELSLLYQFAAKNRDVFGEGELWDLPLSLVKFHYYSTLEADGKCRLLNSSDVDPNEFHNWCRGMDRQEALTSHASP